MVLFVKFACKVSKLVLYIQSTSAVISGRQLADEKYKTEKQLLHTIALFVWGGGWGLKLVAGSFTLIKGGPGQTQTGLQMLRKCNYFRMCVSFGCSVNILSV